MTSSARALLGIGGLCALAGIGWWVGRAPTALLVDNPRSPRRRRKPERRESLVRTIAECQRQAAREARPQTYRRKADAVRALLEANPELLELVESDCGHDCTAYTTWKKRGRRGPKPKARPGDGRFDPLNERWERRTPGRRVASWREALDVTAPASRRWEDFGERVPVLEEATGLRLALPDRAEAITRARELAARCDDIEEAPEDEAIPF